MSGFKDALDYIQNYEPRCPYCDHSYSIDDYDGMPHYDGDSVDLNCPECDGKYKCTAVIDVTYSTVGDCDMHDLKRGYFKASPYVCQICKKEFYDWALPGGKYQSLEHGEFLIREGNDQPILGDL